MSRTAPAVRKAAKSEYIETDTGNKISRRARIEGKTNIILGGRSVIMADVVMRGDLHRISSREGGEKSNTTSISIGRYVVVATGCILKPPCRYSKGQMSYYPMKIGDHVFIGEHIYIGANCVLSPFCMIKDHCKVLPGTVVPPGMTIPPGSLVGGNPAQILDDVGDGWGAGNLGPGEDWVEGGDLRELVRSIK